MCVNMLFMMCSAHFHIYCMLSSWLFTSLQLCMFRIFSQYMFLCVAVRSYMYDSEILYG